MNNLKEIIEKQQTNAFPFRPNNNFYKEIGISKKRFGIILRNEKPPTIDELQTIAKYFDVQLNDLIS